MNLLNLPQESFLDLVDEYRSEEGGYAFKPIPDYELEEFFGLATMIAPDADQTLDLCLCWLEVSMMKK